MADSAELARGIGHFKIATFSRLSGIVHFALFEHVEHQFKPVLQNKKGAKSLLS